jgi:hypothetical protein
MCSQSRRRHGHESRSWRARRCAWRLERRRRDVERQGGVRSGGAGAGAARGTEESGAGTAGARHMASEGGGGRAQRKQRRRELEVDDGD